MTRKLSPTLLTIFLILISGIGVSAYFIGESLSVFTDQETDSANTFTTGTIVIDDSPDSAFITYAVMAPGDSAIQALTIQNNGTLEFRYAMTTSATNADAKALRDELDLTIRTKTASPCSSEDGAILYGADGVLANGSFGNHAQGADTDDRVLAASGSEIFCFKVELPLGTLTPFRTPRRPRPSRSTPSRPRGFHRP
jgi:spore coat-associated protein N